MQEASIPSDSLAQLREHMVRFSGQAALLDVPIQLRLVIDTNYVLKELLWLVSKRKKPSARTSLQEVIDSRTVVAFAPSQLVEEVEEHIPKIAQDKHISQELLWAEWQAYQKYLEFCPIASNQISTTYPIVDPDDLPFIILSCQVGAAAIVSEDRHFLTMGAPTIHEPIIIELRNYVRAKSVELSIRVKGNICIFVVTETMLAVVKLAAIGAKRYMQLPVWLQVALFVGAGVIALHPTNRSGVMQIVRQLPQSVSKLALEIEPVLKTLSEQSLKAKAAQRQVQKGLPQSRRVPLETIAFSICLAAEHPLTLQEIAHQVKCSGYSSQSVSFEDYLRRVLRKSSRLTRDEDGCWHVVQQCDQRIAA